MKDQYAIRNTQYVLHAFVQAFVDELVLSGVRHVCICPGSRSTPLAMVIAGEARLRAWVHVDERSAGFFALGIARALGEPVALVCTSGTAAANFLPAVVEARYARVPLLVLTADRPPELRETGAPQTIDQVRLYGVHARWFVDMLLPEIAPDALRYARTIAARAVATARSSPAGAVHINFPFREPLVPVADAETQQAAEGAMPPRSEGRPYLSVASAPRSAPAEVVRALARDLAGVDRGLIICGPQPDAWLAPAAGKLASVLGWPLLADPLSGVRCGPHDRSLLVDAYDALLRDEDFAARQAPELVLRFGAMPTSKQVLLYLERHAGARQILVDGDGGWNDPTLLASDVVHADARLLCEELAAALGGVRAAARESEWSVAWLSANRRAREAIAGRLEGMGEMFEGKVFAELARLLPSGATLFAGNSMPVRDLDTFFGSSGKAIRFLANRGANGIDGVVSSALGASAVEDGPLVLAIGDLSFYHDMNGLLAARSFGLNATIVLLNNDGGGIFSFLPQAAQAEGFEQLFGTPTGLDFRLAVEMYGGRFFRPASWQEFRDAVRQGLAGDGLTVVEVRTNREKNVAQHRAVWRAVGEHLSAGRGE